MLDLIGFNSFGTWLHERHWRRGHLVLRWCKTIMLLVGLCWSGGLTEHTKTHCKQQLVAGELSVGLLGIRYELRSFYVY